MRIAKNKMILAKNRYYNMNCHETGLNNNVVVIGSPGSGKTRSIVLPNVLQGSGSYVITDPKGNLYDEYGKYLESLGYKVIRLDFVNPERSVHYNPLSYVNTDQDITKLAKVLASPQVSGGYKPSMDPFWEQSATLALSAMIAYLKEKVKEEDQTIQHVFDLLNMVDMYKESGMAELSKIFDHHEKISRVEGKGIPFSVKQYNKVKTAPPKTFACILSTVFADLGVLDTAQMKEMMSRDEIDIPSIGKQKTAVFVVVSDTDRSMDKLANIFFTQAMNELCLYADTCCKGNRLPIDVRFIMDDFATNCKIDEFPRMISSIRSRGISTVLILQAESQLFNAYGYDGKTIIGCCDSYVYLGGNDIETARSVSERCDEPLKNILDMPIGECVIKRRGEMAVHSELFPLEELDSYKKAVAMNRPPIESEVHEEEDVVARVSFEESIRLYKEKKRRKEELVDELSALTDCLT